ncbi:MAG: PIN domain-containing protein [Propionibacteriaceae bacterium]|nr:PIN domain-containing protein [Propionibacteriaceae bacterium]
MPTLDTNCLVRWLVRDDPAKTAKMDDLFASGQHLRVPDVAVIETVYVLESYYRLSREQVAQAIRALIGQASLVIDRRLWGQLIETYIDHPKLSCTDIFLSVDAQANNASPLFSFDKKLVIQLGAVSP